MKHTTPFTIQRITALEEHLIPSINEVFDEPLDSEQAALFLSNPDNVLFLAIDDDIAVGFLTAHRLQRLDARKAEVLLYEIGVHEDYQGRGIGRALIEAVNQWASDVQADTVWVLTETYNAPAMALYTNTGGIEDPPGVTLFAYNIPIS